MDQPLVTPEDHDAGFKDMPLEYHRGAAPEGFPEMIRLTAPSRREAKKLLVQLQSRIAAGEEDPFWPVLVACLPSPVPVSEKFIEALTLDCSALLAATASVLAFGAPWQKKMVTMAEAAQNAILAGSFAQNSPSSAPASAR